MIAEGRYDSDPEVWLTRARMWDQRAEQAKLKADSYRSPEQPDALSPGMLGEGDMRDEFRRRGLRATWLGELAYRRWCAERCRTRAAELAAPRPAFALAEAS